MVSPVVLLALHFLISGLNFGLSRGDSLCIKRKYYVSYSGRAFNATVRCESYFQWTVSENCCYDRNDRHDHHPFCCNSELYKFVLAIGLIILMVGSAAFFCFACWLYNLPHIILRLLTCGKFSLNEYLKETKISGPYADPSFYSHEPFWTSEGSEFSYYPLRPMPPRIFYPTVPGKLDTRRWSSQRHPNSRLPIFILASKQFSRNPFSARPNERGSASSSFSSGPSGLDAGISTSRRSSGCSTYDNHRSMPSSFGFKVSIDEVDAAHELLDALRILDEKGDKGFLIPKVREETETELELDLENELDKSLREQIRRKETEKDYPIVPVDRPSVALVPVHTPPALQPQPLDVLKLAQRTYSGTPFRRPNFRGNSFDSMSSPPTLASISEEHQFQRKKKNPEFLETGSTYSNNIPGYIPEENDSDAQDLARKSISTA